MNDFIRELYLEEIKPKVTINQSNIEIEKNKVYIIQKERKLINTLSQDERTLFNELVSMWDELLEISKEESFIVGFRMGVRLMHEALENRDCCFQAEKYL